ncbi:MAG: hypothetical protein K2X82_16800 [Gemmataceae bacterium]|nr:hypothetical protein [Gemmataceae bacterium]
MDYLAIALILIGVGVALLAAEIVLPTGGVLVVGALLFFGLGVGTILYYGTTVEAVVALAGLAVGLPAAGYAAVAAWRRMSLGSALDAGDPDATAADLPQIAGLDELKGRVGKTVSPLRPGGAVDFEGRRVDALTEGMMVDAGVWVRCVAVKGGRVIVRQLEGPADLDLNAPGPARDPLDDLDLDVGR